MYLHSSNPSVLIFCNTCTVQVLREMFLFKTVIVLQVNLNSPLASLSIYLYDICTRVTTSSTVSREAGPLYGTHAVLRHE